MNHDHIIKQFDEIETKVERIIGTLQAVKTENTELKQRITRLEETLRQKEEAESQFVLERQQIRQKIDGLLSKLSELAKSGSEQVK